MKQRLDFLDTAKGFAIALVILGHIISSERSPVKMWLYSFHMPVFFIISGYLTNLSKNHISIQQFIIKKFKSLIIPYLSFALINYVFIIFNFYIQHSLDKNTIITYIIYIIKLCGRSAIWFLPCLFISQLTFKLILDTVSNKTLRLFIISILFIIPFWVKAKPDTLLLVLLRSFTALGFITIGHLLYKTLNTLTLNYWEIFMLFVINIIFTFLNGPVDLFELKFNNIFIYVANSILGSLTLLFLCKKITTSKLIIYTGKNPLIIMGTHIMLINILNKYITLPNIVYSHELTYALSLCLIVLFIEFPIIFIFNKYLSFTLGKTKSLVKSNYYKSK